MYHKGKRTVEALSELLMLTEDLHHHGQDHVELELIEAREEETFEFNPELSPLRKMSSILVHNKSYEEVTNDNAIRLMLRCCKLYQAKTEISKILDMVIKVEKMYSEDGILAIIKKYD